MMAKRILLVDDSASIRQVAGIALRRAGYDTVEAANGKEALSLLDGPKLNLIISDVNMPEMNGIEFLKAVKQHPTSKFTPVIMLTTEAGDEMKQQGRVAGAKAWVVKPFQPQSLLDAVAKLIAP
jgi:two-component system, chemotaxis family, chemotaxis protein CheY